MKPRRRLPTLIAVASLLVPCLGARAAAADAFGFDDLMAAMTQVRSAHGTFREERTVSLLRDPLESSGELTYRAPAFLERNQLRPAPERLTIEADRLTIQAGGGAPRVLELAAYPELAALIESLRATFAGDGATLRRLYALDLSGTAAHWHLTLRPRDTRLATQIASVEIEGSGAAVSRVEIDETKGDRSVMTIAALP